MRSEVQDLHQEVCALRLALEVTEADRQAASELAQDRSDRIAQLELLLNK